MTGPPEDCAEDRRRIAPPEWMDEPATRAVLEALAAGGVEARFVGGAVRDALHRVGGRRLGRAHRYRHRHPGRRPSASSSSLKSAASGWCRPVSRTAP